MSRGGAMILVVDDHADTVSLVCRLLHRGGYTTGEAADGRAALAFMTSQTPALVILDIQMPELSGLQVLQAMQADNRLRAVPVIMYSANSGQADFDDAMRLGARAFLVKGSVGLQEILAQVAKHASNSGGSTLSN